MFGISIDDSRRIIQAIHAHYRLDLSGYLINSFRFRISKILDKHHIKNIEQLIDRLLEDETYFDEFLYEISAGSTEMFRDPPMWLSLSIQFLPDLFKRKGTPVFWFPRCVSGDELFSLLILLKEIDALKDCQIFVSTLSFKSLYLIKNGELHRSKLTISQDNYLDAGGKNEFNSYFKEKNKLILLNSSLIKGVQFKRQDHNLTGMKEEADVIFIRNQLLNYNSLLKEKLLDFFTQKLSQGGLLILGQKETIQTKNISNNFIPIHHEEAIYQKK